MKFRGERTEESLRRLQIMFSWRGNDVKIAFINRRYHPEGEAGPAFSVQSLAEELASQGHETNVICLGNAELHVTQYRGVQIHRLSERLSPEQIILAASQILTHQRPDIVNTNWLLGFPPTELAEDAKTAGARIVHTVREYGFLCVNGTMFRPAIGLCAEVCEDCRSVPSFMRDFCQLVDGVVGVSEFCLDAHLTAGLFRNTSHRAIIHNSFEGPRKPVTPPADSGPMRLGFLGRIHPVKGLAWFLQQLADSPLAKQVQVVVAGKVPDPLVNRIADVCSSLHVEWLGFVPPKQLMEQIDWLIAPSLWHEPLGRVILEAFAHGVPVLGSRMGGIPELIQHGENGRLFQPGTPGDVLRELSWILENRSQWPEYRKRAWSSRTTYAPEQTATAYLELYRSVLANH
jgi:glycosyltransferase involved in cell wall biosynthesis